MAPENRGRSPGKAAATNARTPATLSASAVSIASLTLESTGFGWTPLAWTNAMPRFSGNPSPVRIYRFFNASATGNEKNFPAVMGNDGIARFLKSSFAKNDFNWIAKFEILHNFTPYYSANRSGMGFNL
jgi:hypothetical protein